MKNQTAIPYQKIVDERWLELTKVAKVRSHTGHITLTTVAGQVSSEDYVPSVDRELFTKREPVFNEDQTSKVDKDGKQEVHVTFDKEGYNKAVAARTIYCHNSFIEAVENLHSRTY